MTTPTAEQSEDQQLNLFSQVKRRIRKRMTFHMLVVKHRNALCSRPLQTLFVAYLGKSGNIQEGQRQIFMLDDMVV